MKLGVLLPTFRESTDDALVVASRCEQLGIDGVFAYDHLWPMGTPTRPSFAPFGVLAAVASRHPTLVVGPLVARVGMVGTAHLITQFRSLAALAPGRVICAVGTGDAKSRDELAAYGLVFASPDERRAEVREVATALQDEMTVWIGAGADATNELARSLGVVLNLWDATREVVADHRRHGPVTWAGPAKENLHDQLDDLESAGADWAVWAPQVDIEMLANWRPRSEVSKFR